MYERLKIARRQAFLQIIVESDSKLLVDMVTTTIGTTPVLIRHIRDLIDLP